MERIHPQKIKQLLDGSLSHIKQPALDRLDEIRQRSLARYAARCTAPSLVSAHLGTLVSAHRRPYWLASVLLAACLVSGIAYWHHGAEHNVSEDDIAILTDDLPINMYVE